MLYIKIILLIYLLYMSYQLLGLLSYKVLEEKYLNTLNSFQGNINFFDKLHRKLKYMSGLDQILPHLNIYNFMLLGTFFMVTVIYLFYRLTSLMTPSILLGFLGFVSPILILNLWCDKRNTAISSEMVTFISLMSRWSIIKDDVYFCIEKSSDKIHGPLKVYMKQFLIHVKYSGLTDQGFQTLLLYSDNALYRNFVINMKQAAYSKGDLCQLLERLEEEAYLVEGEHSRLISDTFFDRLVIGITASVALLMGGFMLVYNPLMKDFYFNHKLGQILLTLYICLFLLALYVTSKITAFNY